VLSGIRVRHDPIPRRRRAVGAAPPQISSRHRTGAPVTRSTRRRSAIAGRLRCADADGRSVRGERIDREDALHVVPAGSRAELVRRGAERPAELQQRGEARFAPGPLEQRDLGSVQIGAFAKLLLGDPDGQPATTEVLGEALLRGQPRAPCCRCLTRAV
jgi:hypothetical protein